MSAQCIQRGTVVNLLLIICVGGESALMLLIALSKRKIMSFFSLPLLFFLLVFMDSHKSDRFLSFDFTA